MNNYQKLQLEFHKKFKNIFELNKAQFSEDL